MGMTPEEIAAALQDNTDVLTRSGAHEGHEPRQVGRCVYCSCGKRVQGQLPRKASQE